MSPTDRKAAKAAYRARKTAAGIYAVRCGATGQVWVGAAPNLETIQNRIAFTLRHGGDAFPALQAAARERGEKRVAFEILETLDAEVSPPLQKDLLKQRAAYWQEALQAQPI